MTEVLTRKHHLADLRTAVYRFFDADDRLLYLGITHNLDERWETHERIQPWWLDVVRREFSWHDTRAEAEQVEKTATAAEKPRYDRSGNRQAAEVEQRMDLEVDRAMEAASMDIANGTYPLWHFLPSYPVLSKKYGIPIVGVTQGLAALANQENTLVYHQDQFAVSRPGCIPSTDAERIGLLYFLASNAFGNASFTLTDLAETTGAARGTAYQHVRRWQQEDRVECLGRAPGGRANVYRIVRHPEPDPPKTLTYWQDADVLALAAWIDKHLDADAEALAERDREIIAACVPGQYRASDCGIKVLKVMARRYYDRPGCLPEWGITEGAAA